MRTSNIPPCSTPPDWSTVADGFRSCRALGWSPLPLRTEDKKPPLYSWPARCIVPLTDDELQRVYRDGRELGVACGYGGATLIDVDAGDAEARALMKQCLGTPIAVVLGARGFKAIFKGPWADVPPDLTVAAMNYGAAGQMLARAAILLAKAKQHLASNSKDVTEAEKVHLNAKKKQDAAKAVFDRLQDQWIEAHQLIRSTDANNGTVAVQVLSFGHVAALPPSRHPKSPTGHYRWEGESPTPETWAKAPIVTREQVNEFRKAIDGKDRSAKRSHMNGATVQPVPTGQVTNDAEALADLHRLAGELAIEPPGNNVPKQGRNNKLNVVAYQLGHHVAAGRLDKGQVEAELRVACQINGLLLEKDGETAFQRTLASGLEKGMQRPSTPRADLTDDEDGGKKKKQSAADVLVQIAGTATLYHAPDGTGFADVVINNHRETWEVAKRGFKSWLRHAYYEKTGGAPASEAMQAALGVIEARCQFEGPEQQTHLRVAAHGERHYLDLCDANWRAIEIGAGGWSIVESKQLPVRFRRTKGMLPLPVPEKGGSVEELRPLLNMSASRFTLCVSWLLAALRGEGQRPVLALNGEQGSAKSTTADMLRQLVDPSTAQLRALPRTLWDLYVSAMNSHVLVFDNLSGLPPDVSDALCRLSTGGGFAARQLYSDNDEVLFNGTRAIILTAIEDIATRPDLIDRSLMPTLDGIAEDKRRADPELWAAFKGAAPRVLGGLLDAAAYGLRMLPHTRPNRLPRMADFYTWMTAAETGCGWVPGTFAGAYSEDIAEAMTKALGGDPAIVALRRYLHEFPEWKGEAADLLEVLCRQVSPSVERGRDWPKTPRALSGRLSRFAPALRRVGVVIERDRTAEERLMYITSKRRP